MIRATYSSRHAEPQRVRSDWRFRAAAIPSHRVAALAQMTDLSEHALLARIWLDVLAIRFETESELDIADLLPVLRLRRNASRVGSATGSRSHWLTAAMIGDDQPAGG